MAVLDVYNLPKFLCIETYEKVIIIFHKCNATQYLAVNILTPNKDLFH